MRAFVKSFPAKRKRGRPTLNNRQLGMRAAWARKTKIKRLEARLDRHVFAAEKLKSGKIRARHLEQAALARQTLREIDH